MSHILIVDDNPVNRKLLTRALSELGHTSASAVDGEQALALLAADPVTYDLVLLDVLMPKRDGYAVLAALKADPALRELPVIMISAVDELDSAVRCIELGATDTVELSEAQSPGIAQATDVREAVRTGKGMLTLVEKVMRLRMVDVFAEAPEEVLAEVAALLTELEVKSGETILARGALCSALYLVVDGQVGLQNGEHNSATLEEGERFGDLALLNPTAQPTAVVALSNARLLRLDQVPLFELLEDHPSVALAIVQRLAQRLQRVGQDRGEQARADLLGGLKEKLGRRG